MKKIIYPVLLLSFVVATGCVSTNTGTAESQKNPVDTSVVTKHDGKSEAEANSAYKKKIDEELSRLSLYSFEKTDLQNETSKGVAFKNDFIVKVVSSSSSNVEKVPVKITYPSSKTDGILKFSSTTAFPDASGKVVFSSPVPNFSCNDFVTFSFVSEYEDATEIKNLLKNSQLQLKYKVSTDLRNKEGYISIVDFSKDGKPITSNSKGSSELLTYMMRRGFSRIGNADFPAPIIAENDEGVYKEAKSLFGDRTKYLIYGTFKYDFVENTSEGVKVGLIANVKVFNLENGSYLTKIIYKKSCTSNSEYNAFAKTRTELAKDLAELLIYGM